MQEEGLLFEGASLPGTFILLTLVFRTIDKSNLHSGFDTTDRHFIGISCNHFHRGGPQALFPYTTLFRSKACALKGRPKRLIAVA